MESELDFLKRLNRLLIDAPNFKEIYWSMLKERIKLLEEKK